MDREASWYEPDEGYPAEEHTFEITFSVTTLVGEDPTPSDILHAMEAAVDQVEPGKIESVEVTYEEVSWAAFTALGGKI